MPVSELGGVRRLTILPCPLSWDELEPADEGGRFCEHCRLRVQSVSQLDEEGFEALMQRASGDSSGARVCVSMELDRGRPKLASGVAASVLAVALAACAQAPAVGPVEPAAVFASGPESVDSLPEMTLVLEPLEAGGGSQITGFAIDPDTGDAAADASVVLYGDTLAEPLETTTDALGMYAFVGLPPGVYEVVVRYGFGSALGRLELAANTRANASFRVQETAMLMGGIWELRDPRFESPGPYLIDESETPP